MPGFDGTGPAGLGPMTGGARGWCNPAATPYPRYGAFYPPYAAAVRRAYPFARRGFGRGFWGRGPGRGWGPGRGRGWW